MLEKSTVSLPPPLHYTLLDVGPDFYTSYSYEILFQVSKRFTHFPSLEVSPEEDRWISEGLAMPLIPL